MGIVLILSLIIYPVAIGITGLTGFLAIRLRKNVRYAGNLDKRTISDVRFIAYMSLILTFLSIPVYNIAHLFLNGSLSYGSARGIANFVNIIQIVIYVVDAVVKLICYFYAIKFILFAQGMIKPAPVENVPKVTTERPDVSNVAFTTCNRGFCPHCGAQLVNGANFCTQCGSKIKADNV